MEGLNERIARLNKDLDALASTSPKEAEQMRASTGLEERGSSPSCLNLSERSRPKKNEHSENR